MIYYKYDVLTHYKLMTRNCDNILTDVDSNVYLNQKRGWDKSIYAKDKSK